MSAKKKTSERPAKSPLEKKIAPVEMPDAPPKTRRAKKNLVEDAVSVARKLSKPKTAAAKSAGAKTEVTAETLVRRTYTRRKNPEVPSILLEGDAPALPAVSGPGEKYSLGPKPTAQKNFFSPRATRTGSTRTGI